LIGNTDDLVCTQGKIKIEGDIYITYWKYEDPNCTDKKNFPVIAMHGGPAFTHNYMIPLKLLARKGYPVIFYDQAGCGASFMPKDLENYPQLLTV
jgi:pimeloyl-ACP methyl ester carboxylesterase